MEIKLTEVEEEERSIFSKLGKYEDVLKVAPSSKIVKYLDLLPKAWGWAMLLPYDGSVELSDYCNYLQHYYNENCSVIAEVTGSHLVDAAETCLKKENELVSLWDSKSKEWTDDIVTRNTYILSRLVQEFAGKVKETGEGISDASTAALLCITKEANLICEMLKCGASPTDYLIIQSTEIRMCALSLMNHQIYGVPAAAAMVGIMKETEKICDWLSKNNEPFDPFDIDLDNDFELGRQVRFRTLHLMISILDKFPISVPAALGHKLVKEKSFSGNFPRNDGNDITPAEAANTTWDNLKDQEKITGVDISMKMRMEGTDKEAKDQEEFPSCQKKRKLRKTGSCHNLGYQIMGSSENIRENHMGVWTNEDFSSLDLEEGYDAAPVRTVKLGEDVLEKAFGWDRLLPFMGSIAWSDYRNYLRRYYECNASLFAELGSLVSSAEVCFKKEEQLLSLWKAHVSYYPDAISPVNSIIQSNLIKERANSIKCAARGETSVVSTIAFAIWSLGNRNCIGVWSGVRTHWKLEVAIVQFFRSCSNADVYDYGRSVAVKCIMCPADCITKEADLMCELLKHGAGPTDDNIQQSSVIRMCALSLVHLQGFHASHAAAAMLGITKECKLMCDWIRKEDKLITFGIFPRHELEECRLIRIRTLDVMLTIMKQSSFPSSKMWYNLMANN